MKEMPCPCCGQPTKAFPIETLASVVSPTLGEMVRLLATKPGEFFSKEQIAAYVWRRDPHGGPDRPAPVIANMINFNVHRLRALGWNIEGRKGFHGGHRLVMLPEAVQ